MRKVIHSMKKARIYPPKQLLGTKSQRTFSGENSKQIALPLGGIGAGCICINGSGGLQDFSIRNRPLTTAMPDAHRNLDAAFATLHVKGQKPITRVVEGPIPEEKIYCFGLKSQGFRQGGQEGFPHFEKCAFKGEFPFAYVDLSDRKIPLSVNITAFNPFIPLDDKNSSIPCAIVEYTLSNPSKKKVDFQFAYHLSHLASGVNASKPDSNHVMPATGVFFTNHEHPNSPNLGNVSLAVIGHKPKIKGMWFRGGWFDSLSVLWREISAGALKSNKGSNEVDVSGRNGGSIFIDGSLRPGATVTYPILITWYFPNCHSSFGATPPVSSSAPADENDPPPKWNPYYTSQWEDAKQVALYVNKNYSSLRSKTMAFHDALFSSTLPSYVLDAVSANLGIIKSPTVLRQKNGNIWAFEGCLCDAGCCFGSCTHVWNYAQVLPHLFPQLERTLREQEYFHSMDEKGHVSFRSALPEGPTQHQGHAASDGQLGGIMKVYREWQISGDRQWLEKMVPLAKRSLDYCIEIWDPEHKGALFEPHHNTYDIEFWGPDGMCSSIYLGALAAMAELCVDVGRPDEASFYQQIAERGARYLDENLFNGEYFEQKVTYKSLRDQSFMKTISNPKAPKSEVLRLLKKEGPKYQYGKGCISDGVIGAWMACMYGIPTSQNRNHIKKNLKSIFQYNFKADLWEHANPQRPGYALGHEPGLLLCTWPKGGKPSLPFVYSDEVWTGIEYQVASHLIAEGFLNEGLTIVQAARTRYNGKVRNPWNEYECGNYYARAMSSYALLSALSGFRYSAPERTLTFGPKTQTRPFRCFFSTATGYGVITLLRQTLEVDMTQGQLKLNKVIIQLKGNEFEIECNVVARQGKKCVLKLSC